MNSLGPLPEATEDQNVGGQLRTLGKTCAQTVHIPITLKSELLLLLVRRMYAQWRTCLLIVQVEQCLSVAWLTSETRSGFARTECFAAASPGILKHISAVMWLRLRKYRPSRCKAFQHCLPRWQSEIRSAQAQTTLVAPLTELRQLPRCLTRRICLTESPDTVRTAALAYVPQRRANSYWAAFWAVSIRHVCGQRLFPCGSPCNRCRRKASCKEGPRCRVASACNPCLQRLVCSSETPNRVISAIS